MTTILVTGATGTIGSKLIQSLCNKNGVTVRAAVRNPDKAQALGRGNVSAVAFDWEKRDTWGPALRGADKLFLLTPDGDHAEVVRAIVDTAKSAGVKHVVKLSAMLTNVEPPITFGTWHLAVEQLIEASGLSWTFLRSETFMDNFIHYWPPDKQGAIYLPLGDAASSYIDGRDVADVASAVLTSEGHASKRYELSGGEALTVAQIAGHIGEATGRKIHYQDVPAEAAKGAMQSLGMPEWFVTCMLEDYAAMKAGKCATVTSTVRDLTGKSPRSFAEFARDNASAGKG